MWRVITWPGWIVVGLAIGGANYAADLSAQVREVREKIIPLAEIRRELDSLRIEQRHTSEMLDEIRRLLARPLRSAQPDLLR
jgi:hypothetical protein